jgi:stage III sporulation protein AG
MMDGYDNEPDGTNKKGLFSKLMQRFKGKKRFELIIIIIIIVAIIAIFASSYIKPQDSTTTQQEVKTDTNQENQTQDMEAKLEAVLSKIKGAGHVRVMITYESGPELVPAIDSSSQKSTQEQTGQNSTTTTTETEAQKPVTVQQDNGTQPLVITEKQPQIRGVIVVAEGAGDIRVKMDLLRAVQTVLSVDAQCVDVFVMNSNTGSELNESTGK